MKVVEIDISAVTYDDRPTTLKTRILAHNQQIVRADRENRTPLSSVLNKAIALGFEKALEHANAIVVSDYDKGVVNRELLQTVLPKAADAGVAVFLDPKVHHADYYYPTTIITPNHNEAELLSGMSID